MKIAILISGQPRNFHKGYLMLNKAYLDRYDCDVYFNTWEDKEFTATQFFPDRDPNKYEMESDWRDRLLELYDPADWSSQAPMVFDDRGIVDPVWRQPLQNTKGMFYSIKEVFDIVPNTYDVYIRTRFDLQYEDSTLDLESLDMDKLHVWEWDTDPRVKNRGYYDVFAIGNYDNIGIYSNVFPRLDWYLQHDQAYRQFLEGDSPLRNEYLLKWHLVNSGIEVVEHETKIPHADGQIIR